MKYTNDSIVLSFLFLLISCQPGFDKKEVPTIGFLDAFEDETIAKAKDGFLDALENGGFSEKNKTLQVIYRNAQGDIPTLVQATDYMISQNVDVIAANPTTSTITAVQKTKDIPVCMMVCSHPRMINLVDDQGRYPANLFGVYDTQDYIGTSVEIIKSLLPKAQKIGVVYNQAEPQSANALKIIRNTAQKVKLDVEALPVNASSETQLVVEALINRKIDAFFALPDNIVFSSFEVIVKACDRAGVPVFTSEEGLVKRGSVAAYGTDMYAWGYQAGEQVSAYLKDKSKGLPKLEKAIKHNRIYNPEVAKAYQIKMPEGFMDVKTPPQKNLRIAPTKAQNAGNSYDFYLSALMLGLGFSALGIGIFISMRIFDIPDITTDGSYTLGGSVTAVLLLQNYPIAVIILATLAAGALAGICTGLIHTKLKVNALLAGILVMTALYSVNLMIMGRSNIPLLEERNFLDILSFIPQPFYRQLSVLLVTSIFLWLLISYLLKTDFGLAMRATGNSESMIRANGVDTNLMKIIGLGISNALVALSGFLIVQYQGFADVNMGIGIVIIGLGSVMIGETLTGWFGLSQIQARILGVILGTILFRLILAFTLAVGIDPNLLRLVTALFVLLVVAIPNLRSLGRG
ncbi:MAG: ABC transporter substrate binding protein [Microscillaceae bacterium]|nr:ABC transporter substrate binding protein [Microscillaceae bacterium]